VSFATGINERGQVVGASGPCVSPNYLATGVLPPRGVIWERGQATDLGNLGGTQFTLPFAISSRGQVVGQSDLRGDVVFHGFLWQKVDTWQKGLMTDLGVLPGDVASFAFGLNDLGQVVGGSLDPNGNFRAYLWQNGVMTDLNTLVKPGSTSLYLVFGNDINSSGEIAAYAFNPSNGEFRAALLIPCDEQHASSEGCAASLGGATAASTAYSTHPPGSICLRGLARCFSSVSAMAASEFTR
jgi:probable HAF family extracellular repeat protein